MAIDTTFYGSVVEATDYFDARLHETAWSLAIVADRTKALFAARLVIDALRFKGNKNTVHVLLLAKPLATVAEIAVEEAAQVLEFPRGADTAVPEQIKIAAYEIAHSLLDGKDPERELEALGIISQGFSSVRTTYSRAHVPIEHIVAGIPSSQAWRFLRPFIRDEDAITLDRVS